MHILMQIEDFLNSAIGLNAETIGSGSLEKAVQKRMNMLNINDETLYLNLFLISSQEQNELIENIVISETWFFRDERSFQALQDYVRNDWLAKKSLLPLKLLSLPCATGEEPYSIAMALIDCGLNPQQFKIEAYDVSQIALAKGLLGIYGENSFRSNDLSFREKYFDPLNTGFKIKEFVRQSVSFNQGNLFDPNFKNELGTYDIVFFRNLLIYLDQASRESALNTISQILHDSGLLFIGHAESSPLLNRWFHSLRLPHAFAYRKGAHKKHLSHKTNIASTKSSKTFQKSNVTRPTNELMNSLKKSLPAERVNNQPDLLADISRLRTAHKAKPVQNIDHLKEAHRLADQGKLDEARTHCETLLINHMHQAEAFYLLGLIESAANNLEKAEDYFHKTIYLEPHHHQALIHLSWTLEQQGDTKTAQLFKQRAQLAETKGKAIS